MKEQKQNDKIAKELKAKSDHLKIIKEQI